MDRRRETAKSRWARRSPRLLPSETAATTRSTDRPGRRPGPGPTCSPRLPSRSVRPARACSKKRCCSRRLAEDDLQHLPVARVGHGLDARPPALDHRLGGPGVLLEQGLHRRRPRRDRFGRGRGRSRFGAAEFGNRLRQPRQLHVVAIDDVLVGVVGVVLADQPRVRHVLNHRRQLLAMKLFNQRQRRRLRGHEFCFSLQVMQTRVHGIALSRASAIGSPQSRQTP